MGKFSVTNRLKEDVNSKPLYYAAMFFLAAAVCISFPLKWLGADPQSFWTLAAIRMVFGAAGVILMLMSGFSYAFRPSKHILKNWDIVLAGLLIAVNNFPIIALLTKEASVDAGAGVWAAYLFFCLSVGVFEEIFFRGLILPALLVYFKKHKAGDFWALIVSAGIFGLFHLFNLFSGAGFGETALQVGYTFLNGLVFALLFYFTKTIYFSIICHTLFDIGGLMIYYLGSGRIWNTPTIVLTAVIGAVTGIYLTARFIRRALMFKGVPQEDK